jgi:UDP-GlcNAc:undecaprenyl-phosphate GlcNAc-1-phosphate transferase
MIGTVMLPVGDWSLLGLMANYLPVLIAAWLATMIATPIVRAIAISTNVVDNPDEDRKIHKKPIAYLGGVAVFIGLIVGIAVSYTIASPISFRPVPISVVVAMMAITVTGFIDDVWGLDPWFKTIGLLVAAGLMSLYGGIGTQTAAGLLWPCLSWVDATHLISSMGWMDCSAARR